MSNRKRRRGICHLCGSSGFLSFEHVPPRAAFNDKPVLLVRFKELLENGPEYKPRRGRVQQLGAGGYTLCESCNNDTGSWYGPAFVDWCYHGYQILRQTNGKPSLIYASEVYPLRIIKQIATMFFSVNGPQFREKHPDLERFVRNREEKYLNPQYRFYVYYNAEGCPRKLGTSVIGHFGDSSAMVIMNEITFPPYGYVLTLNSNPPDQRLVEISRFADYSYYDRDTLHFDLPVLPTYLPVPGDYRTKEEINRCAAETGVNP